MHTIKLGKREDVAETSIGNYGYDQRNERGDTLLNFLQQHNIYAMNSFFPGKPQRKWTWASADGRTKNEIDFIISNRKSIVKNVTVLNRFTTGSDHRMVRAKVLLNTRTQRQKMVKKQFKVNIDRLKELNEEFIKTVNGDLNGVIENEATIDELNTNIVKSIVTFLESRCKSERCKESKLSAETLKLIADRVKLIKDGKRDSSEYREITKVINKQMKKDLRQ